MRRLARLLLSSLFVLVLGGACLATDVPKLTGVFNDETNIISAAKRAEITAFLKEQEALTSNQIVVLVVPTIGGKDVSIAEYAGEVFNTWKLGKADKNNGVLVTFARREGKMRITVGNGLQGALPDLRANQILEGEEIQALLKETKFGSAILATVKAIDREIHGEYKAEPNSASVSTPKMITERKAAANPGGGYAFGFFLLFIFVVFVVVVCYVILRGDETVIVSTPSPRERYPREKYGEGRYGQNRQHDSPRRPNPRREREASRRREEDDGVLSGMVIGSVRSESRNEGRGGSRTSPAPVPSRAPDPEPYTGGGGDTDWGGSETSFDGGDGAGAD